ncbi:cobyric acid synthase [Shewanella cyperi]|nr:cobyric acid synthase [Shewanella cyperi]
MVQGTTSDAGKSTLVAGLCRLLWRRGVKVAPFKPQNMALNSAVTVDGGEIGRAQALQAMASGLAPHTDFNPILLKPSSNSRAQVIVQGKALTELEAAAFFGPAAAHYKGLAMEAVLDSFSRLQGEYAALVVEGAGSPAEINLRANDIANMGFAEAVDCPVILIADIDRGGVFAHLVGTLALLSDSERERVKGLVINRFRGDLSLLAPGIDWLEQHTGKPVLGVLPYIEDLQLDAEDALPQNLNPNECQPEARVGLRVGILVYPRISNHTDFDPLLQHPALECQFLAINKLEVEDLRGFDLLILPGSKNVRADLELLRSRGMDKAIARHLRYGGKLIGICGGYQMLGLELDDPLGVEHDAGACEGLGLLPLITEFKRDKTLLNVSGELRLSGQIAAIQGYEIHCGQSQLLTQGPRPLSLCDSDGTPSPDGGCLSQDGAIFGTYLHGLFDSPEACDLLLAWAGLCEQGKAVDLAARREAELERLADVCEQHLDLQRLATLLPLALN